MGALPVLSWDRTLVTSFSKPCPWGKAWGSPVAGPAPGASREWPSGSCALAGGSPTGGEDPLLANLGLKRPDPIVPWAGGGHLPQPRLASQSDVSLLSVEKASPTIHWIPEFWEVEVTEASDRPGPLVAAEGCHHLQLLAAALNFVLRSHG